MKVAFVTDTGTGKSCEQWEKEGIFCLPLQLECEGISYDEYQTITHEQVIQKLHEKKIFRTSLPKLGYIQDILSSKGGLIFGVLIPCLAILSYDIMKMLKKIGQKSKLIK